MTGPEHYREAECLLQSAAENFLRDGNPGSALDAAQVHAALALVAVTAMQATVGGTELGPGEDEFQAWYDAAGVKPEPKGGDVR